MKPSGYWQNYDHCYEAAKECLYRSDFKRKYPQAYKTASNYGWIDDYTWFLTKSEVIAKSRTVYTKEICYEEAKKYTSKTDFHNYSHNAYVVSKKNGWFEDYTWFIRPKQYNGKFDYDYCYEEAKKYKTRSEFKAGCSCGYRHARINKWLDDYDWFVNSGVGKKKWNKETCYSEAKKYEYLIDFEKNSSGAYNVALRNGWLQDYVWLKRKHGIEWSYEKCYNEAKKCKNRNEFSRKSPTAYNVSYRNGWIDDYTWFVKYGIKWTYQTCYEEAKKYKTRSEFSKNRSRAYQAACTNGWIDDYTWFVDGYSLVRKWNKDTCLEESKKYKSRGEFSKKSSSAYQNACKSGWIDDYIWLKDERFDLFKDKIDCVYVYEFSDLNAVYVGRTLIKRKEKRDKEHLYDRNDAVVKFAIKHNVAVPLPKYLEDGLTIKEGVEKECFWIARYREMGWNVLNRIKGGSLGGLGKGNSKYTYDVCFEQAKLCNTKTEFNNLNSSAYNVARCEGWIDDYTWFKDGRMLGAEKRRKYDYQTCYEEAKKYNTPTEFKKGSRGAYRVACTNGWMKDYDWIVSQRHEKWTKEACYNEAKKYTTMDDFKLNSSPCYSAARRNKWIDDYDWLERQRIKRGTWQNYDACYNEAKKYKTLIDFKRKAGSAYASARTNGWIDDYDWLERKISKK